MSQAADSARDDSLPFTGERYLPGVSGVIELEHIHRYLVACTLIDGKDVLDIASGEGYGTSIMARSAKAVVGVDISVEAVGHAVSKYKAKNLQYLVGSCDAIPLESCSVDVVVSFETIEHHDRHVEMMREIKRVLRPNGVLLISCPDKREYSDKPSYVNPYHVKELYREEFENLLAGNFANCALYGQKVVYGSAIFSRQILPGVNTYLPGQGSPRLGVNEPLYMIAVASDGDLPGLSASMYEAPVECSDAVQSLENKLLGAQERLKAEQINAEQQIRYRDDLVLEFKKMLDDEKQNARQHIEYRDALVKELEQKLAEAVQAVRRLRVQRLVGLVVVASAFFFFV